MTAGQLNRVVTLETWEYEQDDAGGTSGTVIDSWEQRAAIDDRSSYRSANAAQNENQAQQKWEYDFKITVRFIREIKSTNTLLYEGYRYTINEVVINSEGHKRFYILRCTKLEAWQAAES